MHMCLHMPLGLPAPARCIRQRTNPVQPMFSCGSLNRCKLKHETVKQEVGERTAERSGADASNRAKQAVQEQQQEAAAAAGRAVPQPLLVLAPGLVWQPPLDAPVFEDVLDVLRQVGLHAQRVAPRHERPAGLEGGGRWLARAAPAAQGRAGCCQALHSLPWQVCKVASRPRVQPPHRRRVSQQPNLVPAASRLRTNPPLKNAWNETHLRCSHLAHQLVLGSTTLTMPCSSTHQQGSTQPAVSARPGAARSCMPEG